MYIKAWRTKRNFAGGTKPRCGRGGKAPCFAVCAVVCDPLSRAECVPAVGNTNKRGPFVGEVEKRDERWSEIQLLLIVGGHREPGNVCI